MKVPIALNNLFLPSFVYLDTSRRSVLIVEEPKNENKSKVDTELTPRRSGRSASQNASQKIAIQSEDTTPELSKPRTRRSVAPKALR